MFRVSFLVMYPSRATVGAAAVSSKAIARVHDSVDERLALNQEAIRPHSVLALRIESDGY